MTRNRSDKKRLLLQGNEAIAEGALAAGCRFFAGYPITPASEIGEVLSKRLPALKGTFIQMEDEIASMGAVIGASLAGVKSMTATSGPGFSLMQENIGFACVTEVPCVIVDVMRGGASTGLPTSPGQGDVMQARWGTHGDHSIIVLAVSTVRDCFDMTIRAFNLSEEFRVPVILLSDEVVSHTREVLKLPVKEEIEIISRKTPDVPPEWYLPYGDNSRGVPDMSPFGRGYRYHVTGLVHDVKGFPTQRPDEIKAFSERLFRKISHSIKKIQIVDSFLMDDADVAVVAYGSVARTARHAVIDAREHGVKAGLLQLITLFPFPQHPVEDVLKQCRRVLVPEMNMGQIERYVKRVNRWETVVEKYSRVDGRFITPDEISHQLLKS
ncbi:MAG: 2-oxoacid:acceptor oxidoreductase subunit alpha [Thermodesulfobacteriota bacterium]|nr:2-oxoacid:acceptor oxidoreductase subunit alpha [Thermodesulfobacteriota bacterium]